MARDSATGTVQRNHPPFTQVLGATLVDLRPAIWGPLIPSCRLSSSVSIFPGPCFFTTATRATRPSFVYTIPKFAKPYVGPMPCLAAVLQQTCLDLRGALCARHRIVLSADSENVADLAGDLPQVPVSKLEAHQSRVTCCTFNPKKSLLATGAQDSTVRVWSVPNRTHQFLQQTCVFNRCVQLLVLTVSDDNPRPSESHSVSFHELTVPIRVLANLVSIVLQRFSIATGKRPGLHSREFV